MLQYFFCFVFWFFGYRTCGVLAPQPRIEPSAACTGRRNLSHWTARELPLKGCLYIVSSLILSLPCEVANGVSICHKRSLQARAGKVDQEIFSDSSALSLTICYFSSRNSSSKLPSIINELVKFCILPQLIGQALCSVLKVKLKNCLLCWVRPSVSLQSPCPFPHSSILHITLQASSDRLYQGVSLASYWIQLSGEPQ